MCGGSIKTLNLNQTIPSEIKTDLLVFKEQLSWNRVFLSKDKIKMALSLVGERNLVAGNASGEEFFLASLVGEDLAGKISKFSPPGEPWRGITRNLSSPGSQVFHPGQTGDTRD